VLQIIEQKGIDYDYVYRINSNDAFNTVNKALASNFILTIDSNYNTIVTTDTNLCHMGVRSTTTQLIKNNSLLKNAPVGNNLRTLFKNNMNCLNCPNNEMKLKPVAIIISYAKFLGFNRKVSDIDYIDELREKGIRDKVSIILINMDLIPKI